MAKSGKGKRTTSSSSGQGRSGTTFVRTKQFDKAMKGLDKAHVAKINDHAQKFEQEWRKSQSNEDISPGFNFKQLYAQAGQYRVCQIYVGTDFRLAVTFLISRDKAYWVHAWKKSALNNHTETELAKKRAKSLWATVQQEGK